MTGETLQSCACWDVIIKHRNDICLTKANYFSWLATNLWLYSLLKDCIQQVHALSHCSHAPTTLPIAPENQPYFRGPRVKVPCTPRQPLPGTQQPTDVTSITAVTHGLQHLSNWSVYFGMAAPLAHTRDSMQQCGYNSDITNLASMLTHFNWEVYGFNSGHFISTIKEDGLSFHIFFACNPCSWSRTLL